MKIQSRGLSRSIGYFLIRAQKKIKILDRLHVII